MHSIIYWDYVCVFFLVSWIWVVVCVLIMTFRYIFYAVLIYSSLMINIINLVGNYCMRHIRIKNQNCYVWTALTFMCFASHISSISCCLFSTPLLCCWKWLFSSHNGRFMFNESKFPSSTIVLKHFWAHAGGCDDN